MSGSTPSIVSGVVEDAKGAFGELLGKARGADRQVLSDTLSGVARLTLARAVTEDPVELARIDRNLKVYQSTLASIAAEYSLDAKAATESFVSAVFDRALNAALGVLFTA